MIVTGMSSHFISTRSFHICIVHQHAYACRVQ